MTTLRFSLALACGLMLVAVRARVASAQSVDTTRDTLQALTERIEQLDQQIRIMRRRSELQHDADSIKAASQAGGTVAADGATFRAADGGFVLRFRGYVHQDGRYYNAATPAGTNTFVLRRVRPILEAASGPFSLRIMYDFGEGKTVLQDAYIDAAFSKSLQLRAGKFKPPVGFERLMSATSIRFVERAFPTALVPNRDLGVQLQGSVHNGMIAYAAGLFDGVNDGSSVDTDINDNKEAAARIMFAPGAGISVGVGASQGKNNGVIGATGIGTYKSPGQLDFFSYRSNGATTGTVLANGTHTRLSPQGSFFRGPIGVMAEYVTSAQDVILGTSSQRLTTKAWDVTGGYVLTGEDNLIGGVRPRVAANPSKGQWGALELTARVHAIDLDDAAFPTFADATKSAAAAHAWAAGFNWYLNRNVKFVADYEHTSFDGGATNGNRPAENLVFSRIQFAF